MEPANTKAGWRKQIIARRLAMASAEQLERSRRIQERAFALLAALRSQRNKATDAEFMPVTSEPLVVALYTAIRGEADIAAIAPSLRNCGCVTVVPVVRANRMLQFIRVSDETLWQQGAFGIHEPASGDVIAAKRLNAVLVPGVAFDRDGFRVGYGGGFYDMLFSNPQVHALRIGVCYNFQLVRGHLPIEPHDVPMHNIVTDEEVVHCDNQRRPIG